MPILGAQSSGAKGPASAPTVGTATVTNSTTVSLAFTAPSFSKLPITSYTVTSSPSIALSTSGTSTPLTVTGSFASDQAYTFTIIANHANGSSTASSASNSITPFVVPKFAYAAGGGGPRGSSIEKLSMPGEAVSTLGATLTGNMDLLSGHANSGTAGYAVAGRGTDGNIVSRVDKITFSNDAKSTLASSLADNNWYTASCANSGTAGYTGSGFTDTKPPGDNQYGMLKRIYKITYSNDSTSVNSNDLPDYRFLMASHANSGTAGYWAGGYNYNASPAQRADMAKMPFSNQTPSTIAATLVVTNHTVAGFANSGTAGYTFGGEGTGSSTRIEKLAYSNDTNSTVSAPLSIGINYGIGASNNGTAGYVLGASTANTTIQKLTFSGDTVSTVSATFAVSHIAGAAFANSGIL
jgi:trimeric autotransporter adhesin